MGFMDELKNKISGHSDSGVDQVEDTVNDVTDDRFDEQVGTAADAARDHLA